MCCVIVYSVVVVVALLCIIQCMCLSIRVMLCDRILFVLFVFVYVRVCVAV